MFRTPDGRPDRWFAFWFGVCAVISLTVLGVFIWAVISAVNHFTA